MKDKNLHEPRLVNKNILLFALVSFFSDVSSEMLYPLIPIFLTQYLSSPATIVGIVQGFAEGSAYFVQGFSGWISDKIKKPKLVTLIGYLLGAVAKPFIGFSTSWSQVLPARWLERTSAGIRSAPRDALIANSVSEEERGKAFGLEGVGDQAGAVVGPLVAIILYYYLHIYIRNIFLLAFIPGIIAFIIMIFIKQPKISSSKVEIKIQELSPGFWKYIFVIFLFGIGNSSNSFLILRATNIGIPLFTTILIYTAYNLVGALASYPAGYFSDKIGRRNILIFALIIFFITYLGFGFSRNYFIIGGLFVLYGIYQGVFRGTGKAIATDLTPPHIRATGVGIFSSVVGATGFFASIVGGILWDKVNPQSTFYYGAIFAFIGAMLLLFIIPQTKSFNKK